MIIAGFGEHQVRRAGGTVWVSWPLISKGLTGVSNGRIDINSLMDIFKQKVYDGLMVPMHSWPWIALSGNGRRLLSFSGSWVSAGKVLRVFLLLRQKLYWVWFVLWVVWFVRGFLFFLKVIERGSQFNSVVCGFCATVIITCWALISEVLVPELFPWRVGGWRVPCALELKVF